MKVLGGQVPLWELALIAAVSFLMLAMGFSLPLLAGIALIFWPLLLFQMLLEGTVLGAFHLLRGRRETPAKAELPKRHGVARYIWMIPPAALLVGFVWQYFETGSWFF